MGTLAITKSYAAGTALFEVDIDAFRNGLHTLLNTDLLGSINFSGSTALTSIQFTGNQLMTTDNDYIQFGATADGLWGLDADKKMVFNTGSSDYELRFVAGSYYVEFSATKVNVPGDIIIGADGGTNTVLQALSSYRKPVIQWNSATTITLQNNSGTTDQTIIYFPTTAIAVTEASPSKYRYASISSTANGYATGHTGAVLGGRRSGVSLTSNSWYYVYAVKVQSGNEYSATSGKFIMVFDTVSPEASNGATLNGHYGTNNWVYMGMIRYGYGATGSSTSIVKFLYSNKGRCSLYGVGTSYGGLALAYTTTDADNLTSAFYTLAAGTSGNVIPSIIGHVTLQLARGRTSDWKIRETSTSSSDVIWSGGFQTDDATLGQGFLVELPNIAGFSVFQERKSSVAGVVRAVTLAGFTDGYMMNRRHGHGI